MGQNSRFPALPFEMITKRWLLIGMPLHALSFAVPSGLGPSLAAPPIERDWMKMSIAEELLRQPHFLVVSCLHS